MAQCAIQGCTAVLPVRASDKEAHAIMTHGYPKCPYQGCTKIIKRVFYFYKHVRSADAHPLHACEVCSEQVVRSGRQHHYASLHDYPRCPKGCDFMAPHIGLWVQHIRFCGIQDCCPYDDCDERIRASNIKEHVATHGYPICDRNECEFNAKTVHTWLKHRVSCKFGKLITCQICSETMTAGNREAHLSTEHAYPRCPHCGSEFPNVSNWHKHVVSCLKRKPFDCPFPGCNERLLEGDSDGIRRHMDIQHNGAECTKCATDTFPNWQAFVDHVKRCVQGILPVKCSRCKLSFPSVAVRTRHDCISRGDAKMVRGSEFISRMRSITFSATLSSRTSSDHNFTGRLRYCPGDAEMIPIQGRADIWYTDMKSLPLAFAFLEGHRNLERRMVLLDHLYTMSPGHIWALLCYYWRPTMSWQREAEAMRHADARKLFDDQVELTATYFGRMEVPVDLINVYGEDKCRNPAWIEEFGDECTHISQHNGKHQKLEYESQNQRRRVRELLNALDVAGNNSASQVPERMLPRESDAAEVSAIDAEAKARDAAEYNVEQVKAIYLFFRDFVTYTMESWKHRQVWRNGRFPTCYLGFATDLNNARGEEMFHCFNALSELEEQGTDQATRAQMVVQRIGEELGLLRKHESQLAARQQTTRGCLSRKRRRAAEILESVSSLLNS